MSRNNEERLAQPKTQQTQQAVYTVPTDFVKLPSGGKFYPESHALHNVDEIEVSFMTTKQEDILVSPSYNEKGIMFDRLIESIMVSHNVVASTLLEGDRNAILINARKNAYGDLYNSRVLCESCYEVIEVQASLSEIKNKEPPDIDVTPSGTFIIKLPRLGASVELKLYTGQDREEIKKRTERKKKHDLPEETVTDNLRQMIVSVDGRNDVFFISDFIGKIPPIDTRYIASMHRKVTPNVDITYEEECESCQEVNKGGVPIDGDFFWFNE